MGLLNSVRGLKARAISKWKQRNWIPAWTSPEEQAYLVKYAERDYLGRGEIVDLGCLLGATTISLAKGLRHNSVVSAKTGRIHAYDLFRWEDSFSELPGGFSSHYRPGEDFLPDFQSRIVEFADLIKIYPGDLTKVGWCGDAIEFLLVDANKSWDLCEFIGKNFHPHLLTRRSFVFDQDFKHYYTPWVHILNFRIRAFLEAYDELAGTCSFVFKSTAALDPAMVPSAQEMRTISDDELDEVYRFSLSLIPNGSGWERANIMASKVMFYIHLDRAAEAQSAYEAALRAGFTVDSDLKKVARLLTRSETR
ncbi:MAG: hypothetical protein KIS73_07450 [Enhydrobacter sp.]|nr:hypothetical protein [Enhydrobacter sp.]